MIRPDYRAFRQNSLIHSAKGTTWENHKYIKRVNGTYYYPDSYEGGRHLPNGEKEDDPVEIENLSAEDIETLAKEVIRGNFGDGQVRKELLGDFYQEIQNRVNEILRGTAGSKKVSEVSSESIELAKEAAKNASSSSKDSNVHSGVDMDQVLSVYRKKK